MSASVITVIERSKIDAINGEHVLCERAYEDALTHALECGRMLAAVKAAMSHGDWLPWVETNFAGSLRIAQRYMQLADAPELANASEATHLTIGAALQRVAKPRPSSAREGIHAIVGLEDDEGDERQATSRQTRDPAPEATWDERHTRRQARILAGVDELRSDYAKAGGHLSVHANREIRRTAAVKARLLMAQLEEPFSFEQ